MPGFVGATQAGVASGVSVNVAVPAGAVAGDLLLAWVVTSATVAAVAPSGWAQVVNATTGGFTLYATTWTGSPSTFTFGAASSVAHTVILLAYNGYQLGGDSDTISAAAASPTPPAITVPAANSINLTFVAGGTASQDFTMPAGWTSRQMRNTNRTSEVFERDALVAAGSLAGVQVTRSTGTATSNRATQISLSPIAAGPTGRPKVFNGTEWVEKPMKVWNGSAWVEKPVKFWNGSAWVLA